MATFSNIIYFLLHIQINNIHFYRDTNNTQKLAKPPYFFTWSCHTHFIINFYRTWETSFWNVIFLFSHSLQACIFQTCKQRGNITMYYTIYFSYSLWISLFSHIAQVSTWKTSAQVKDYCEVDWRYDNFCFRFQIVDNPKEWTVIIKPYLYSKYLLILML